MRISSPKPTFKSGLTPKLLQDFNAINVRNAEANFAKIGIKANLFENKFVCGCSMLTADILQEISAKYKLPFNYLPPAIRVYKDSELFYEEDKKCYGICAFNTTKILKDEQPFIAGSLFFNGKWNSADTIEDLKHVSTNHFLHVTLHEWFHCIHTNLIFKNFGYEGDCPVISEKYGKKGGSGLKKLHEDFMYDIFYIHKNKVAKYISKYAASQCCLTEIFAELMSKITVKSLNSKLQPTTNPLDYIPKDLPKSIKKCLKETLEI